MPESRSSLAVPPVETSSTPNAASLRAKSTSPDLSVTLRMARWILDMRPSGAKGDSSSLGESESSQFPVPSSQSSTPETLRAHSGLEKNQAEAGNQKDWRRS